MTSTKLMIFHPLSYTPTLHNIESPSFFADVIYWVTRQEIAQEMESN